MRIALIFWICFSAGFGLAQTTGVTSENADSLSYAAFMKGKHRKLKNIVKDAEAQGIDLFYLPYRLGISYYNKQRFEKALAAFRKCENTNPADPDLQKYIYVCLLATGRTDDAQVYLSTARKDVQEHFNYQPKNKALEYLSVQGGLINNNRLNESKQRNFLDDNLYVNGSILGSTYYGGIQLGRKFGSYTHLSAAVNVFHGQSANMLQSINFNQNQFNIHTNTNYQFVLSMLRYSKKQWFYQITGGFYPEHWNQMKTFLVAPPLIVNYEEEQLSNNALYGYLRIGKRKGNWIPMLAASTSNFSGQFQFQSDAQLGIYPFGNQKLYLQSTYSYKLNGDSSSTILNQLIGWYPRRAFGMELSLSHGNQLNYLTNAGFVAFNATDPVTSSANLTLFFTIRKLTIAPSLGLLKRVTALHYKINPSSDAIIEETYRNFNALITFTWKM